MGPGSWPKLASQVIITLPGQEGSLKLRLSDMIDGREYDKIKDSLFDLETLVRIHEPSLAIDLDAVVDEPDAQE